MRRRDDDHQVAAHPYLSKNKSAPPRFPSVSLGVDKSLCRSLNRDHIQAALGVAQLEQLPGFLKRKREIFQQYQITLNDVEGLSISNVPDYADNNHWMNMLQIDSKTYGADREELMARLEINGIQTRPVWVLNHIQKPYQQYQSYKVEKAGKLANNSLCLPSSTNLTDEELNNVIIQING